MKFLDLFAGIGGFRLGMEQAGHECVGFVEWDKYARRSYEAIHDTRGEWTRHDITQVTNDEWRELRGKVDVICGGFPCQSFSTAGKRGGFEDTRGTMFFEIARAVKEIKPRYLLLENVKGLLSHNKGRTFGIILNTLDELGYDIEWQVCNSKDYVPQNRERVFIVGHIRGSGERKVFPIERANGKTNATNEITVKQRDVFIIDDTQTGFNDGIKIFKDYAPTLRSERFGLKVAEHKDRVLKDVKEIAQQIRKNTELDVTILENGDIRAHKTDGRKSGISELNINYDKNTSHTVTASHAPKIYGESTNYRIRKLTAKECWRLQTFPDYAFDRASEVNSDSQLYKQAGNAVTVSVVKAIAERLGNNDY